MTAGLFMQAKANRSQSSLNSFGSSSSLNQLGNNPPTRPSLSLTTSSYQLETPSSSTLERPALAPLLNRSAPASPTLTTRSHSHIIVYSPSTSGEVEEDILAPPQPAFAKSGSNRSRVSSAATQLTGTLSSYFADPTQLPLPESAPATPTGSRAPSFEFGRSTSPAHINGDSSDSEEEEQETLQMQMRKRQAPPSSPRVAWDSAEAQRQREQARMQAIQANSGGSPFAQSSWKPAPFRSASMPSSPEMHQAPRASQLAH
jgi:hypothetical protein